MSAERDFVIFTDDGERHAVSATSLRLALKRFGREKSIVAAIEGNCLPIPKGDSRPFVAVLLRNPRFVPPEEG